jgi:5-oxoprolinase (ATP-hydrolysing) subunit A
MWVPWSMATIDLNADLGETVAGMPTADDEAMFAVISSASIACGGHAGDAASLRAAVDRAARFGVAVGAHPSYPDAANFGRVPVAMAPDELTATIAAQLSALVESGADLRYVKPHGALYHAVAVDAEQADAVVTAIASLAERLGRALPVLGLHGEIERAAQAAGLGFVREAFLDRGYLPDGMLVPRSEPGALLHDPAGVAARAVRLVREGVVQAADGSLVTVEAASLCVHGDSPDAVAMARAVRAALDADGIEVRAPW